MTNIKLIRNAESSKGTYGVILKDNIPLCATLELPWRGNKENVSCIPMGEYKVKRHRSPTKNKQTDGEVFWLQNVKDRSYIYIHIGNWTHEILGCILVGAISGKPSVSQSALAMKVLLKELPDEFTLEIFNALF